MNIGVTNFLSLPLVTVLLLRLKILSSLMHLYIWIKSPLLRRVSCVDNPILLFRSSGVNTLPSRNKRVIRSWTFSILMTSPLYTGFQSSTQYSRWGLTYSLNMLDRNLGLRVTKLRLIRLISKYALLHAESTWWWNFISSDMITPRSRQFCLMISS